MARPAKKVSVQEVAWVAEYLVSRVNRASYKLKLYSEEKRNLRNGNPKAEVYRLAAQAIDLQRLPTFGQEQLWLEALEQLLKGVNAWIDDYLPPEDRTRLWTAHRVAQARGIDRGELIFENYQMFMSDKQKVLDI